MFPGIKRMLQIHRERIVSLVLLPAFFLASLPQSACICGDGHRERFCSPGHCRACLVLVNAASKDAHSCCHGHNGKNAQSCCDAKHDEGTPPGDPSGCGLAAQHTCDCHGTVDLPAPAEVSKKSDGSGHSSLTAIVDLPSAFVETIEYWPALSQALDSTPPPLDAVIVYLHLTI